MQRKEGGGEYDVTSSGYSLRPPRGRHDSYRLVGSAGQEWMPSGLNSGAEMDKRHLRGKRYVGRDAIDGGR